MRAFSLSTALLPALAASAITDTETDVPTQDRIVLSGLLPKETGFTSAVPALAPSPTAFVKHNLELRQTPPEPVPAPAAPAAPNNKAPPAVPNVPDADPATTSYINTQGGESVTVMWLQSWIDKTSQTWYPKTITITFAAVPDQGPPPGEGHLETGPLTGRLGHTQTIVVGAAPTKAVVWKGILGAVGVGVLGLVA